MTALLSKGMLRWMRAGQPVWHLTWDGVTALCGYRGGPFRRYRQLKAGPPKPVCSECQLSAKVQLGLP